MSEKSTTTVRVERTGDGGGDRMNYDIGEEIDVSKADTVRIVGVDIRVVEE